MKSIDNERKQTEIYVQVKELRAVRSLLNKGKEHLAIVELEKLVYKYPKNCTIKLEYAKLLSKTNRDEEALLLLNNLEQFYLNKLSNIEKFTLYYRMLLSYFHNKDYEKVIYYYHNVLKYIEYAEFSQKDFRIFLIYALKELNKLGFVNTSRLRYSEQQVVDYNKEKAINHIRLHLNEFNKCDNEALFRDDIDIENLYCIAREKVKTSKKNYESYVMDIYNFKYSNIGVYNGKKVNVLQVVCIGGTDNIISMYPIEDSVYNLEDLVEISLKDFEKKSQIQKFKNKYEGRV